MDSMSAFCQSEFKITTDKIARNVNFTNVYYGGNAPSGSCIL